VARSVGPSLTRDQVVRAALDVVNGQGPGALSIKSVAARLRIQPPSLYHHVRDRDDLIRAAALEASRGILAALREVPAGPSRTRLLGFARAIRGCALAHPHAYALAMSTELDDTDEVRELRRETMALLFETMAPLGLDELEIIHRIRAIRASVHGFVMLELGGQFQLGAPPDESFERLVEMVVGAAVAPR
jgi:AcrR family transcriptional regulator